MKKRNPSKNQPCPCGSGKQYKRCCEYKPKPVAKKVIKKEMYFNKKYNRYESEIDHHYTPFNYTAFKYRSAKSNEGQIKIRLVHTEGASVIIPEYIFLNNGWIQPLHFHAPALADLGDDGIVCDILIDINGGETINVRIFNNQHKQTFRDNSQLFDCTILGPDDIENYTCGEYEKKGEQILLKLYHHTNAEALKGITKSKLFWSSPWNYKGNYKSVNYSFVYFTHIPEIKHNNDLMTIAMASDGKLDYCIDSFTLPSLIKPDYRERYKNSIYTVEVPPFKSSDKNKAISLFIPIDSLDIKHVYKHKQGSSFFYEVCFPYIHRVKLNVDSDLAFTNDMIDNKDVVLSDYAIIGDATCILGLAAPFEEENTDYVFKIEDCAEKNILDYWFKNANKDLYSKKKIDKLMLTPKEENPTND